MILIRKWVCVVSFLSTLSDIQPVCIWQVPEMKHDVSINFRFLQFQKLFS